MAGTTLDEGSSRWCRDSVYALSGLYWRRPDGHWQYNGERPGSDWHSHGYFGRRLVVLRGGEGRRIIVYKQRWRQVGTTTTCHSRPPDDPRLLRYCTLIVVLRLWGWVRGAMGLHNREDLYPELESLGSDRTAQRWMRRALGQALEIEQAIRLAIIGKSEPRPMERLFEGGLSPPRELLCHHWQDNSATETLWRSLAMLLVAARKLGTHTSLLLAEARRRMFNQNAQPMMI